MSVVDITSDFLSYVEDTHISYNSSWNTSSFLKSANNCLQDMITLQLKIQELKKTIRLSSRFDKQKNNKMILNIKQSIKMKEQGIKRLSSIKPDIKGNSRLIQQFKDSMLAALQMRLLKATFEFKQAYLQNSLVGKQPKRKGSKSFSEEGIEQKNEIDLKRSYFIERSEEELIEEVSIKQYKQIEKSINQIFDMYKQSMNAVKMHDLLIDSIQNNIGDIDQNVQQGKNNISQVHRRGSKNRNLIIKMFTALYIITFVYIVFLS